MPEQTFKKPLAIIALVAIFAICALYFSGVFKKHEVVTPAVISHDLEPKHVTIGKSVEGRDIDVYTYGSGSKLVLFVGGMHGGYEWNSVLLAYQFVDYLKNNPNLVPEGLSVAIIPSINPDGVYKVVKKEGRFSENDVTRDAEILASGRFNANKIDLNRNFGCNWAPTSMWKSKVVSAGKKAFSEPEAETLKNYVEKNNPSAVIFWHSQANAVYASECNDGILPATLDIMNAYSKSAGYPAVKSFDSYKITGDSEGWLASVGIPAITVEMKTHESIEWDKNLSGFQAVLDYFTKE
jgi:hypothetical protein